MNGIEATVGAATYEQLDDIARGMWRSYGQGHIDDIEANALSAAIDARRAALSGLGRIDRGKPATASRRRCRSPERSRSIARRRQLAASGVVPGSIAVNFTQGELAVLSVIAREIRRTGACDWFMDKIAAVAGVCRTTARNALRQAQAMGLIALEERRRNRWRSDTNVITMLSKEWAIWLRLGGVGAKSRLPRVTDLDIPPLNGESCQYVLDISKPTWNTYRRKPSAHTPASASGPKRGF